MTTLMEIPYSELAVDPVPPKYGRYMFKNPHSDLDNDKFLCCIKSDLALSFVKPQIRRIIFNNFYRCV
jgi:hypothetical protein